MKYYRTKNGAEIDFVLKEKILIEIKSSLGSIKINRSYHYFLEHYRPLQGYILNYDQIGEKTIQEVKIRFLPHFMASKLQ